MEQNKEPTHLFHPLSDLYLYFLAFLDLHIWAKVPAAAALLHWSGSATPRVCV